MAEKDNKANQMVSEDVERLLVPTDTAHVVGTKFPKDKHKIKCHVTVCMPDGFYMRVPIYENESAKEKLNSYVNNWYKVTKNNSEKYNHFTIKDKCPRCGGELRAKVYNEQCFIWCINHPECDYHTIEEGAKVRERIYEKYGLKTAWAKKTGCTVVFSNHPVKKK